MNVKQTFTVKVPKKWKRVSKVTIPAPPKQEASGEDVDWMFEMLGWKKDARRPNRSK